MAERVSFLRQTAAIVRKDLRAEWRSREVLVTSAFFGFTVVLVFSFSFFRGDAPLSVVSAGIMWVSVTFAGNLALSRIFERERIGQGLKGLLMLGARPSAIFAGKLIGVVLLLTLVQAVVTVAVVFFFSLGLDALRWCALAGTLFLGGVGFSALGVILSAVLLDAKGREVLLSVVLIPLVLPVLIIGVKATTSILETNVQWDQLRLWLRVLLAFDIVFVYAGAWLFGPVTIESS